jgi:hypothetical protein
MKMKWHTLYTLLLLLFTAGAAIGCDTGLPEVAWEGKKIRFATTEDHLPCGRALEILDEDVMELEEELGLALPGGVKITYYWLPYHMHLSPCSDWGSGCALNYTIFTTSSSHHHEVVHILTSTLGPGHAFLSEGFAEAFNRRSRFELSNEDYIEERIKSCLIPYAVSADIDYPLAGKFTRFLITEYGLASAKTVYSRLSPGSDESDYDRVFKAVLGGSLNTIIDNFVETEPECYATPSECHNMEPSSKWENGVWEHHFAMSCDEAVGEASGGEIFRSTVVDVPSSGPYKMEVDGTFGFKLAIRLIPCGGVDESCYFDNINMYAGEVRVAGLDAGRYEISASSPNTESTVVDVRLTEIKLAPSDTDTSETNAGDTGETIDE